MKTNQRVSKIAKSTNVKKTLESFFKKTALFYRNTLTGNVVSYLRAHNLGIDKVNEAVGVMNPKTGKIVKLSRGKSLGLAQRKNELRLA